MVGQFVIGFGCRDLALQVPPLGFGPAIGAGDPGRGAGVDPTVERLVALAQLPPFEPGDAALIARCDQLLGGELLDPLGGRAERKMRVSAREVTAGGDLLVGRAIQPQEAVGLRLEDRDRVNRR
jgi:hypothetical protein